MALAAARVESPLIVSLIFDPVARHHEHGSGDTVHPLLIIGIAYKMAQEEKPIGWIGSSYQDLCAFPDAAKRRAGHELHQVQEGLMPSDWKPMATVGPGTFEIRIGSEEHGGHIEHRVFYVARFEEAIWVLHAFQKTTRKTSRHDIQIGKKRYHVMLRKRKRWKVLHGQ